MLLTTMIVVGLTAFPVLADGDVASAVEATWGAAKTQIKTVVNNVVFPALDMILAVMFLLKSALATLITESMASLSLLPHVFYLPVWCLH